MVPRTVDAIALGPNVNLEAEIRCFSFLIGRVISRQWQDVKVMKMPENVIIRINFISNN